MTNSISNNESSESSDTEDPDVDFEQLINQAEKGEDEDWGLSLFLVLGFRRKTASFDADSPNSPSPSLFIKQVARGRT